jgi:hypothetical protein
MSLETAFLLLGWGSLGTILVTALCSSNRSEDRVHVWARIITWGLVVLGSLGCLFFVLAGIATKADMNASAWAAWAAFAAWFQAFFSAAAISVVVGQNVLDQQRKERERDDRAKVVVARLSIWLGEVGSLVDLRTEDLRKITVMLPEHDWYYPAKLELSRGIDGVMSDLHYLRKGSADVAQLDAQAIEFDKLIEKAGRETIKPRIQPDLLARLQVMKQLHDNAVRLLGPVMDDAANEER